jgi:hypothetical protein
MDPTRDIIADKLIKLRHPYRHVSRRNIPIEDKYCKTSANDIELINA